MKNIVREVFSLPAMDVVKASYKDSVYYIAGSSDITEYVSTIKDSFDINEIEAIKHGLNAFLKEHPINKVLNVPKYNLALINTASTSDDYVLNIVTDIFRKDIEEAHNIVDTIKYEGLCVVGTYTYEIAHTFACMVETANMQMQQDMETDIIPVYKSNSMDSLEVIEQLIRRDHPEDL
ncbi:ATP-dependent protease [Cronobacter phage vB_CsaM_GAP32]|uniref:ATP-dependent Clp protease n=1 Tax=Cronobacter phage vB_CsaM_GAP32 TaxID=1141136 RepID=K4FB57_9CAUD|nr:ATP-dependent protease [Cronobacter phage vB_CsaM_GAP32]AFC21764.1 ATP-dependent Clp protease [Cronobacter phage vB_CsaM_GAP32]